MKINQKPKFRMKEQVYYNGRLYVITGITLEFGRESNWWSYDIGTPTMYTLEPEPVWSDRKLMRTQMEGYTRVADTVLMRPADYVSQRKRELAEKRKELAEQLQSVERQLDQYED